MMKMSAYFINQLLHKNDIVLPERDAPNVRFYLICEYLCQKRNETKHWNIIVDIGNDDNFNIFHKSTSA